MTKKNALATANNIALRCDDAFLFACKVGTGVYSTIKAKGNWTVLLSLLLNVIEDIMRKLNRQQAAEAKELLCLALLQQLTDEKPSPAPKVDLTDKQRRQRAKHTELIVSQLEAVL